MPSDPEQPGTGLFDALAIRVQESEEHLLRGIRRGLGLHEPSEAVAIDALAVSAIDLGEGDGIAAEGAREHIFVTTAKESDASECQ
jgi:hypothetical protein